MTQKEKELLLIDLCGRLLYGVIVATTNLAVPFGVVSGVSTKNKVTVETKHADIVFDCTEVKPYLRPMSSMTEEECKELGELPATIENVGETLPNVPYYIEVARPEQIDWLNKKMFAYRTIDGKDMFELGLAIKAPKGMYEFKEK